ncbi:carboxypeptidase-like regulatory domain-containing protein [Hymenobacter sp. RP-2-7]|uniref:Carboxypeptidase-like regulatory domain-containing protein n=1 Tax=Hymenobacter polaris TaxID=2682546 RepID=A0A7Y0AFY4_9BACT|nr:carboxypeptidase-like regulatory domain-containing protein [Hymenobacter polaris]NML66638.1 carboxypeptidase-like regulatory domain-containing protein [Hymenobacter polaris]
MALTANPFHPATGELLPSYRDAYLRGDLSAKNTELVDAYLKANPSKGSEAYYRFHTLQTTGHSVRPVGWLDKQLNLLRTEPRRFRHRAGSLVLVGALISGAVFAASGPVASSKDSFTSTPVTATTVAEAGELLAPESVAALTTISGRILNEKGQPLVGATVLDKRTHRGVSTDAQGRYSFAVPRSQHVQLQFGYGGYQDADLLTKGQSLGDVALHPRTDLPKKRWWQLF